MNFTIISKKIRIFYIIFIFLILHFVSPYIILPFNFSKKNFDNEINDPLKYFDYYMNNTIYTKLRINEQLIINFRLTMEKFIICISNKIYKHNNKINFSDNIYSLNYLNIKEALFINDSFNLEINNINNQNINMMNNYNFSFFLVIKYLDDSTDMENAEIGLNRVRGNQYMDIEDEKDLKSFLIEEKANLIFQLKKMNLINSTIFSIKYNKDEEGEIIIGDFPHIYDDIHFSENNLFMNSVTLYTCPPYNWYSRFRELIYNNKSLIVTKMFYFSIDHGFIEAPLSVKQYFEPFFKNYSNSCKEDIFDNCYVFYCKKDVIKNFNSLTFIFQTHQLYKNGLLDNLKMEFSYKDLFLRDKNANNDIYYFQIVFNKNNDWIFGKPVFKKYRIVFDQDKKMYGIYNYTNYINYSNENINNEKKKKKKNNNNYIIYIIILIILIIIIIFESFLLIRKIFFKQRNKRANELKEDYDYECDSYLKLEQNKNIINN